MLAPVKPGQLNDEQSDIFNSAVQEYIDSQLVNADRPEAQLNLGNYYSASGKLDKAGSAYERAIKLDETFTPAYINLADLYRVAEKDDDAKSVLQSAIKIAPEDAAVNYALGLLMVRQQQIEKSIRYLKRAAGFDTSNARYVYVYAVALNSAGQGDLAIDVLQDANNRFPRDTDILDALISFHRDAGNDFAARTYMNKLEKLRY